jgi:hypothetical protein
MLNKREVDLVQTICAAVVSRYGVHGSCDERVVGQGHFLSEHPTVIALVLGLRPPSLGYPFSPD